jgi:tetratricopeptide (TPR) repeat protein
VPALNDLHMLSAPLTPPCLPRVRRRLKRTAGGALLLATLVFAPLAQADELTEVRALLARGEPAAALKRAEAGVAAQPRDAQLRFLLGVALMDLGRDADALAHFTRMAQDYPELPDPHNNIALLHARAGRLEMARQALETALRNDPGHRTARINLGQVHLMLAVQAFEAASAEGPLDAPLLRRLEAVRALLAEALPGAR